MSFLDSRLTNRDSATVIGLLTAAGVYLIYENALPKGADVQASAPHDPTIEKSRKGAAIKSAALVGATFVIARDLNSYILSGVALVGIDLYFKHANAVHPATGKVDVSSNGRGNAELYPVPNYTAGDESDAG